MLFLYNFCYYFGSAEGHEYPVLQVGDEVTPRLFLVLFKPLYHRFFVKWGFLVLWLQELGMQLYIKETLTKDTKLFIGNRAGGPSAYPILYMLSDNSISGQKQVINKVSKAFKSKKKEFSCYWA
jgi:hypothetical protein